jgi:pyruvate dehydrogenase E2 component (dihydrolipoamide acetyltransferase)
MPISILMPALSPTMSEGTLAKWCKKEGDVIQAGDVIAEIETDKATMEVEAVDEGILGKILIAEATDNVAVNTPIAVLLEEGESMDHVDLSAFGEPSCSTQISATKTSEEPVEKSLCTAPSAPSESTGTARLFITPLAKRIAFQGDVDPSTVQGSGPRGRIVKADVEKALSQNSVQKPRTPSVIEAPIPSTRAPATAQAYEDISVNGMRKTIAKRLTESKLENPHFYLSVDCELDALLALRKTINETLTDIKVSVNDMVIKAVALALRDVPQANVSWLGDKIRQYKTSDISVAVAIEGGLITPVVKQAEHKTLSAISMEVKDLAQRARDGKLKPEEYQGGSFSISNLGMFGVKQFNAIINPPQACILAVGAGEKRAVVAEDDTLKVATVMTTTLSVDHRAVDGAVGASFLKSFKNYIQNPMKLLV